MDKKQILECIKKIKQAQSLIMQVDKKIATCNYLYNWHIFKTEDFKAICKTLGIEYTSRKDDSGYNHLSAYYDDLKIATVEDYENA